ncbi:hypothetical protein BSU01_14455 [Erwinia billingiae]|nr:hypothetical protein [Erwinia billingiae]
MDVQAYRVAVRIALDDQITRNMLQVSRDAIQLNKKFVEMAKNIKAVTSAAKEAASAMRSMNSAMNNQFSGATRGANEYASAMRSAADHAQRASTATRNLPALSGGYGGGAAFPVIAAGALALSAGSAGGGNGGYRGRGNVPALPGPGGTGGGWSDGWQNGVPPGGWGGGVGNGGRPPSAGNGPGSHANGMTNLALGYGGFHFMQSAVEVGAEYQTMLAKFSGYGMGEAAVKEADKFAQATKIMGASKNDMLRFFTEAQGVFRESGALSLDDQLKGARLAAPMLAKMHFAMASMDPAANHMSQAKEMDMLRFVEQAGGLNSPMKFNSIMNNSYKAVQASGGNIDFSQLRQFMSRAGTSAYSLSDTALYAKLEPVIGEMKGGAAGDALMTAFNRLTGITKLPNQVVRQLENMGVWDASKIVHNGNGGIKYITGDGNPLKNSKLLANDPVDFYEKVIRPKYAAKGLTEEDIMRQNSMIFGRQGGKMFNLIEKQMHVIDLAAKAYDKQMGIDEASKQTAGTYNGKQIDFNAKWKDFQLALAQDGGLLDTFTSGLDKLSNIMQRMTDIAHKNPELAKFVAQAALAVTGLATLRGGMWLMKHAAEALFSPIKFLTGSAGLPKLGSALSGLQNTVITAAGYAIASSGVEIYRRIKAMAEGKGYDQIASQSAEMSERDRLAHENAKANGGGYRPWSPTQADFDAEKGRYPSVPPKSSSSNTQPVNLLLTHEGRQVLVATVVGGMSKQATKAPASTSAFDSSMLMTYPGQVSKLSTPN